MPACGPARGPASAVQAGTCKPDSCIWHSQASALEKSELGLLKRHAVQGQGAAHTAPAAGCRSADAARCWTCTQGVHAHHPACLQNPAAQAQSPARALRQGPLHPCAARCVEEHGPGRQGRPAQPIASSQAVTAAAPLHKMGAPAHDADQGACARGWTGAHFGWALERGCNLRLDLPRLSSRPRRAAMTTAKVGRSSGACSGNRRASAMGWAQCYATGGPPTLQTLAAS